MQALLLRCQLLSLVIIVAAVISFRTFTLSDFHRGVAEHELIKGPEASFVALGETYRLFFGLGNSLVGLVLRVAQPGNRVCLVAMRATQSRRLALGHDHRSTVARPLARTSLINAFLSHDGRQGQ